MEAHLVHFLVVSVNELLAMAALLATIGVVLSSASFMADTRRPLLFTQPSMGHDCHCSGMFTNKEVFECRCTIRGPEDYILHAFHVVSSRPVAAAEPVAPLGLRHYTDLKLKLKQRCLLSWTADVAGSGNQCHLQR